MKFKIHTIRHTLFAANHLVEQLRKLGHEAIMINEFAPNDETIYIIYNAATCLNRLPKNYIVYQTEIGTSYWFKQPYINCIKNALAVWDYSEVNTSAYKHVTSKIAIVTPGINPQPPVEKTILVLFYGWINGSARRALLTKNITPHIPLTIVTNELGNKMWTILAKAKVVINLHYYDNSPLELFRINEALSFGCNVVSEGHSDRYPTVSFGKNYPELVEKIKEALHKPFEPPIGLDNLEEIRFGISLI